VTELQKHRGRQGVS